MSKKAQKKPKKRSYKKNKPSKEIRRKKEKETIVKKISEKDFEEILKTEKQIEEPQERTTEFLQNLPNIKAPVLERVAFREENNLRNLVSDANIQTREREEDKDINYNNTRTDYLTIGEDRGRNGGINNVGTDYNGPIFQETKESRETRRMTTIGEFNPRNMQRDIKDFEKPMDLESEDIEETKKYLNKRDYE